MRIEINPRRVYLYIILLPLLKPGIVNNTCYTEMNNYYSILRIAIFVILIARIFISKNLRLSHYTVLMAIYEGWVLFSTVKTDVKGVAVWAGPALSIITVTLLFDLYEDDLHDIISVIGNILFVYFVLNEITVLVSVIISGNTDIGLAYFNHKLPSNQYFLGMDNRFICYYFPGVICNIISSRQQGIKYGAKAISILLVGGVTLIWLWAVGGMIGMTILLVVIFADEKFISGKIFNAQFLITMMLLVDIALIAVSVSNPGGIQRLMQTVFGKGGNFLDRVIMWRGVLYKVFAEHPLAGIGAQTKMFMSYFMRYNHAHNLMMTVLYQGGIVGELLFWVAMYVGCDGLMGYRSEALAKIILSVIVVELFTNFADTTFDVFFVIMVCLASKYVLLRESKYVINNQNRESWDVLNDY